ncbi:Serine/arginine repetitive matrix protein 2, putative isoform 3, partial [Theobroma cacao]
EQGNSYPLSPSQLPLSINRVPPLSPLSPLASPSSLFMARSLSQTVIKLSLVTKPRPSSRLLPLRTLSNQPNHSDPSDPSSDTSSSDPLLQKLEDAIHRIIVRRSAPDWLPFIPGSSYWVPPSTAQSYGLAQLVEKLANPLTPEESMSTTTVRGWPSSEYFIKGKFQLRIAY